MRIKILSLLICLVCVIIPASASDFFTYTYSPYITLNITSNTFGNLVPYPNGTFTGGSSDNTYHRANVGKDITFTMKTFHCYTDHCYFALSGCGNNTANERIHYGDYTNKNYTLHTAGCTNTSKVYMYEAIEGIGNFNLIGSDSYNVILFGDNPAVSASFSQNRTSGYVPLVVSFTDTSTGSPTSWDWNFGDGYKNITSQNPIHQFNESGVYEVSLIASKTGSSSTYHSTVTVNDYSVPECSYHIQDSEYTGTSPLFVSIVDDSTNNPTSYFWNFNTQNFGWFEITPSSTNNTKVQNITITGTGVLPVFHSATNPAGTGNCGLIYFNISGPVPTPTPTPAIPFPNQTGVCLDNSITLGSNVVTDFDRYASVTEPDGNQFDYYYPAGKTTAITGSQLTRKIGQYYYAERNITGQLLFQSSYVTENCYPTPTQTITYTHVPTPVHTVIPQETPVVVTTTFSPSTNLSARFEDYEIHTFRTLEPERNTTGDLNITVVKENLYSVSPLFQIYTDFCDSLFYPFYYLIMDFITTAFGFLTIWGSVTWVINLFNVLLGSFNEYTGLTTMTMTYVMSNIPPKVQNVISFCLLIDIIKQVYNMKRGDRV